MRLGSLKLTYFFSHQDEEIVLVDEQDRPIDGVFFLSGESESGKSTAFVDAICFALFGPRATRVSAHGLTQRDLRNRKASDDDETRVEATFVFDDGSVMGVSRSVPAKGSGKAQVWEVRNGNDIPVATSAQAADRYICDRLGGLSRQQLPNSFVARQEEIDALAQLQGAERRKAVHAMLGVSELEIARKENSQRQRAHELRLRQLDTELQGRTLEAEQEAIADAEQAHSAAEQTHTARADELATLRRTLDEAAAALAPYEQASEAREQINKLESAIAQGEARMELLAEQAAQHRAAAALAARQPELRAAADEAAARLRDVQDTGARTSAHASKLAELAAAKTQRDQLLSPADPAGTSGGSAVAQRTVPAVAELEQTLRALSDERARLETERSERDAQLSRLRDSGECYVCQRGFDSHDDHTAVLELVEEKIASIDERLGEIANEHTTATDLLPHAREIETGRARVERELISADARIHQLQSQLDEITASGALGDVAALRAAWKTCKEQADAAAAELTAAAQAATQLNPEAEQRLAAGEQWLADRRAELAGARGQLADAGALDADEQQRLTAQVTDLRRQIAEAEGALPLLKSAAEQAAGDLQRRRDEFEALRVKLEEREEHHAQALKLMRLADMLQGFTESLVSDIRPTLEQLASDMLAKVTNGRRVAIRLDDDYNIDVQDADGEWFAAASLSGGARVRAAICLRLALTRLVSQRTGVPIRFLVMDEPLPSQDPGHVAAIMDLLDSLRGAFPQIFIISHVGDLHNNEHVDYVMRFSAPPGEGRIALTYA